MEKEKNIKNNKKDTPFQVGGQAVIEGVMMRSPSAYATAVRRTNGEIIVDRADYQSITAKHKFLKLPIMRGAVGLIEMLSLGIKTLNFSAEIAMKDAENKQNSDKNESKFQLSISLIIAIFFGILLFFVIPLTVTTKLFNIEQDAISFNIFAGVIRLIILLGYIWGISRMKDIQRIFQYHGAEHKAVFAYELNAPLTIESIKNYSRFHPRCGTSFLLIVALTAIMFFGIFDALYIILIGPMNLITRLLTHLPLVPIIGGISYEFIKISSKRYDSLLGKILIAPGLWLQRITTQEPDDSQLEVAITALKTALMLPIESVEKENKPDELITVEIN